MTTAVERGQALIDEVLELFEQLGRNDLVARLNAALVRAEQARTLVCVIGAFKSGKSSLVNAIVGDDVSPVHHHEPTSVPVLVEHAERAAHTIVRSGGRSESVSAEAAHRRILDPEEDDRMLHVAMPFAGVHPALGFLDTPGIGGLTGEAATASLMLARDADAVVFVTEAGVELSPRDLTFLEDVHAAGVWTSIVATKTDLFTEWRRVVELDRDHVSQLDEVDVFPVSAALRAAALELEDPNLDEASGIPSLITAITDEVGPGDPKTATLRALETAAGLAHDLGQDVRRALAALDNPEELEQFRGAESAMKRLESARSSWRTMLSRGIGDLRRELDRALDHDLEAWERTNKERLDEIDPATDWAPFEEEFLTHLQTLLDDSVALFHRGIERLAGTIAGLLDDETPTLDNDWRTTVPDPASEWRQRVGERKKTKPNALTTGFTALRGAQGGLITAGMMGGLAGLTLMGPVAAGLGVVFAAKQLREFKKTSLEQRRAEAGMLLARLKVRIHREMTFFAGEAFSTAARQLEEHFMQRISAIHADLTEIIEHSKQAVAGSRQQREQRKERLETAVVRLQGLSEQIAAVLAEPEVS